MEEDYIILEWRVERRVKKKAGDRGEIGTLNAWSTVSHAADYCNWADIFHVFSQGMYVTTIEELENTKNVLSQSLIL